MGLLEHLVPTLDELVGDLEEMHASTGIDLDTWPAARALVDLWRREP